MCDKFKHNILLSFLKLMIKDRQDLRHGQNKAVDEIVEI